MSLPNPINVTYVAPSVEETFPYQYIVKDTDNIINIDSTNGEVHVILRNIRNSGLLQFQPLLSVNDGGNNASVNNITIYPSEGDVINDNTEFVINTDGGNCILQISNINQWVVSSTQTSGGGGGNLQLDGGADISTSLTKIADINGNISPLQISTDSVTNKGGSGDAESTAFGNGSLINATVGEFNTSFGAESMNQKTSGDYNTSVGNSALRNGDGYDYNVAIGYQSLYETNSGNNTAVGALSLRNHDIGNGNVAVGWQALYTNTEGDNNIAIGNNALYSQVDFSDNIAIGNNALNLVQGANNVAIGSNCLASATNSSQNIAIGHYGLSADTLGSYNIAIGINTACNDFSRCLIIGDSASASGNNQVVIGTDVNPLGGVVTEVNTSSKYWEVTINGVVEKILLA